MCPRLRHPSRTIFLIVTFAFPIFVTAQNYNQEGFGRPALLMISYPGAPVDEEGRRVRAMVSEIKLKTPLPARSKWRILPGTTFPPHRRPKNGIKVKLYTDKGANRRLLCAIQISYFRNRRGRWQPHYKLDSDTVIIWRGNVWAPLNPVADEYNVLFLVNTRSPNGQGFHRYLDLRSSTGPVTVDSWIVGQGL